MPLARVGDHLWDGSGHEYTVGKFLGEGVTAEVYKATRGDGTLAALKILRPSLPREIAQSFRDEIVILSELTAAQRNQGKSFVNTPLVLGTTEVNASPEFIALEYVSGQSLDELITNTGGLVVQDRELDALKIAQQTLNVLRVLHENIRRSYTDFQLKNIWLLEGEPIRIKVMDWNHVSKRADVEKIPFGSTDDLIRFGAYLYYLLTGKGALQTGETEGALAYRAGERWQMVSLKTRAILIKALHLTPSRRYQHTAAFLNDIEQVVEFWAQDVDDLFDEASLSIRQIPDLNAEDISTEEYLAKTSTANYLLDMYTRRSSETRIVERMQQDLQRLTDGISTRWGAGRQYYEEGIYSEAIPLWQAEAQNLERLDLWRWATLAVIARSMRKEYVKVKERLEQAILALEKADGSLLQNIGREENVNSNAFSDLYAEAKAWSAFHQGKGLEKAEDWTEAADAYRKTAVFLKNIKDETYLQLLTSPKIEWPYPTLPDLNVLADMVRACNDKQRVNVEEEDRIAQFRQELSQVSQTDTLGTLVEILRDWFLEEKNQPALLQAIAEEAEKQPLANALALLSAAILWGKTTDRIQQLWREKQKGADAKKRKEMAEAYQKRVEEEESVVLEAIQAGNYAAASFYVEQLHIVSVQEQSKETAEKDKKVSNISKTISPKILTAIKEQFEKAVEDGREDRYYTAQKWLAILKQMLSDEEYMKCQAQMLKQIRKQFHTALQEMRVKTAKKWLDILQPLVAPAEYEELEKKWQRAQADQDQREIERKMGFMLQEARALISDGRLEDAKRKCTEAFNTVQTINDSKKRKRYEKDVDRLNKQILKLKRPIQKSITVEDYLKRLSDSDLEDIGDDIKMKIKKLGNIEKKSKHRFWGSLFAVLLSVLIMGTGLFTINSSQKVAEEQGEVMATDAEAVSANVKGNTGEITRLLMGSETLSSDVQSLEAEQTVISQIQENLTQQLEGVDDARSSIEAELNDILDRVQQLEGNDDKLFALIQPVRPSLPRDRDQIGALITPTVGIESGDEPFVFPDAAFTFDIPNMQIEITDDAQFQAREDDAGYEVIGSGNNSLGTMIVRIIRDGIVVDEGVYPVTEGVFAEDAPQHLSLSWKDTAFKLLPPGFYELQLVTQRDLEIEPAAIIGMPYEFEIYPPVDVNVYNPTAAEYPTRLRTSPTWDCGTACVNEELSKFVQVVAYAIVPYEGDSLPYKLPITPTNSIPFVPILSFDHPLTVTSVVTPTMLYPEMEIGPNNIVEYADPNTDIVFVGGNVGARFFLVRLPGTREYFWLGEIDTLEFYYPELRQRLIDLPELIKPPVDLVDSEG